MPAHSCWRPTARMDSRRWTWSGWRSRSTSWAGTPTAPRSGRGRTTGGCGPGRPHRGPVRVLARVRARHHRRAGAGRRLVRAGPRLVDEAALDCVEQGYVLVPGAMRSLMVTGDAVAARAGFARVAAVGDRFGDADLGTLGRLGEGHARVLLGDRPGGVAMLDEAMVAVTAGEVSPQLAGLVYFAVIEICQETFDLRRARDWTEALTRWCASQPDLEPYRGNCLVHRAESAAGRRLGGGGDRGRARVRAAVLTPRTVGCRRCLLPAGRAAPSARRVRPRPRTPTARPATGGGRRNRGSRCCGWRRAGSARRRPPSTAPSPRRPGGWPEPGCSPRRPRRAGRW